MEVYSLEWNKNNTILAVICKSSEKVPSWTIRVFEFDINRLSYRSSTTNLKNDFPYYTLTAKWFGNDLFIVPKYKEGNLDTINVYPYKLNKLSLNIEAWASDKALKSLKYSHFVPSNDGAHFILGCLDRKKYYLN